MDQHGVSPMSSQGRGPDDNHGGMAKTSPWGWCTVQPMARSMEEVATFIPADMLLKP